MSNTDGQVTVLLAAPCDAQVALREALAKACATLVEVDPLTSTAEQVLQHQPRNVVVLLDGASEDALDRFDSVLANPSIRLLFEEASVVTARQGWDSARWSRHLAAKLHGSTNVLPEGVGDDQGFVAPNPRDAIRKTSRDTSAGEVADEPDAVNPVESTAPSIQVPERALDDVAAPAHMLEAGLVEPVQFPVPDEAQETEIVAVARQDLGGSEGDFSHYKAEDFVDTPFWEHTAVDAAQDAGDTGQVAAPAAVETAPTGDWQQFQAYDVDHTWSAPANTQTVEPIDFDRMFEAPVTPVTQAAPPVDETEADLTAVAMPDNVRTAASASFELETALPEADELPSVDTGVRAAAVTEALNAPTSARDWSLLDYDEAPPAVAPVAVETLPPEVAAANRFSGLSLIDDGSIGLEGDAGSNDETDAASVSRTAPMGAVLLVGGAGGPDPLRTVLGGLPAGFPHPILVLQHLDAGNYDRLARQMERASDLPVKLAEAGMAVEEGTVYVVSPGLNLAKAEGALTFVQEAGHRDFVDLTDALSGGDSALAILSGASVDWTETAKRFAARGAWIAAQAEIGCFDFNVPSLAISRGAEALDAAAMARKLAARWNREV